ncbi:MAG TPA: dihydrofolate reductase family protein [Actinophytocola sp.]|uniref:dihydrofolate reductase family protein n=1 Tax=Actinophytocola sp. TaxID=1872138 RepID=UPI002DDCDD48|nr:dihydrofolate reductase family protein [Actinophytocola sp.]HEV2781846.1 dihydrofolate reductase family protein [Actinophytocola sp.]
MSKVFTSASMSLDGFIAGPGESGFEHLFQWYDAGEVALPTTKPDMTWHLTPPSAAYVQEMVENTGALVVGRRLFDLTKGWDGNHPFGTPVVVLTHRVPDDWPHPDAPFHFVTDGIESAVAKAREIAGDRWIGVNGGTIARQCLDAGLLDEINLDLVPVLLGSGTPFFEQLGTAPVLLDGPTVTESARVTHLRYRVRKS